MYENREDDPSWGDETADPRSAIAAIQRRVKAYRAIGEEVPAELVRAEQALLIECYAQSQGR